MRELSKALDDFSRLFERLGVEYAVMGGIAVRAHGIPRPTQDVDFTVAIERSRLAEFYEAAGGLGYTVPEAQSRCGILPHLRRQMAPKRQHAASTDATGKPAKAGSEVSFILSNSTS